MYITKKHLNIGKTISAHIKVLFLRPSKNYSSRDTISFRGSPIRWGCSSPTENRITLYWLRLLIPAEHRIIAYWLRLLCAEHRIIAYWLRLLIPAEHRNPDHWLILFISAKHNWFRLFISYWTQNYCLFVEIIYPCWTQDYCLLIEIFISAELRITAYGLR